MTNCLKCSVPTDNRKFCSSSCSASYNQHFPRKRIWKCKNCNEINKFRTRIGSKICDDCQIIKDKLKTATLRKCEWHLCNKFAKNNSRGQKSRFCSKSCKSNFHVKNKRKNLKQKAIAYKGGKCIDCGYSKSNRALCFHHILNKKFGISRNLGSKKWEMVKKELDKCVLLCANCHAERHDRE